MWINHQHLSNTQIQTYRKKLQSSCPNYIVIDNLFDKNKLDEIITILQQPQQWKTQQHTYSALYVDHAQWQKTSNAERFVQRDAWQRQNNRSLQTHSNIAQDFLLFLRSKVFMHFLSQIFNVKITDINVADPDMNTNYFRLGADDFIGQHADDSPGREVCMLLYLNKGWSDKAGGELSFMGNDVSGETIQISPLFNRCVLFDPASKGSEHWVKRLNKKYTDDYRYNVTSWYWTE